MAETSQRPDIDGPKRRSARIVQAVPLTITGVDALGRPFQERTSTVTINCHGCRYLSKHYVLKNMWVSMEVPHNESGRPPRKVRGRVSWIQRPRTVRELFQVGVELESSGNFWGIAFPPADWFPFPEAPMVAETEAASDTAELPMQEGVPEQVPSRVQEPAEDSSPSPVEQGERSIRIIPMPHTPDSSGQAERQVARLVSEAQERLQTSVRESVSRAVTEQTQPLLSELEKQVRDSADKSVENAVASNMERLQRDLNARLESEHDARIEQIRAELSREREHQISEARAQIEAQLGAIEQGRRSDFDQQIQNQLRDAIEKIEELSQGLGVNANIAQATIEQARREAREAGDREAQVWEERLKQQEAEVQDRMTRLEEAAKRVGDQISTVTGAAEIRWSSILDGEIALAQLTLQKHVESSIESAVNGAIQRLSQSARETEEQVERQLDSAISQSAEEAEARLAPLRDSMGQEVARTQNTLAELQGLADQLEARRNEFSSLIDSYKEQLARHGETLLEAHTKELGIRSDAAVSVVAARLQPAIEASGQETIDHFVSQFEEQIAPHVARATEIVNGLSLTEAHSSRLLAQHQDILWQASERILQESVARAQDAMEQVERKFAETAQVANAKWGAELETKATETTQSTFEALYKSADWYEKKLVSQLQSALEKGLQEGDATMREKAGEISGLFASELDRYSRNFVEHAQRQIEEHSQAVLENTNLQATQAAEAVSAGFAEKTAEHSRVEFERWQKQVETAFEHHATKAEERAAQIRQQLEQKTEALASEFLSNLAARGRDSLEKGNLELLAQFEMTKERMRQDGQLVESDLQRSLESLGIRSMEEYRQRLENTSNSWMLTTVSKLHQQSESLMEQVASSAESKLRAACSGVFAEIGENLKQRLSTVTLSLEPQPGESLNHRAAAQGGQG